MGMLGKLSRRRRKFAIRRHAARNMAGETPRNTPFFNKLTHSVQRGGSRNIFLHRAPAARFTWTPSTLIAANVLLTFTCDAVARWAAHWQPLHRGGSKPSTSITQHVQLHQRHKGTPTLTRCVLKVVSAHLTLNCFVLIHGRCNARYRCGVVACCASCDTARRAYNA